MFQKTTLEVTECLGQNTAKHLRVIYVLAVFMILKYEKTQKSSLYLDWKIA